MNVDSLTESYQLYPSLLFVIMARLSPLKIHLLLSPLEVRLRLCSNFQVSLKREQECKSNAVKWVFQGFSFSCKHACWKCQSFKGVSVLHTKCLPNRQTASETAWMPLRECVRKSVRHYPHPLCLTPLYDSRLCHNTFTDVLTQQCCC